MPNITHIKIPKIMRDELKIAAIRSQTTLYELTKKILQDYLKRFNHKNKQQFAENDEK